MIYVGGVDGVATIGEDMRLARIEDDRIAGQTIKEIRCGSDELMYCLSDTGDLYALGEGKLVSHVRDEDYFLEKVVSILPNPERPGSLYAGTEHYLCHGSLAEEVDSWDVFVYTDGVPEVTNAAKGRFGTERLVDALNHNADASPEELTQIVQEAVGGFVGDAPQFDDMTMLCCRMNH